MSLNGNNKGDLDIGMKVEINPRSDRSRKILIVGEIEELLTNAISHPHGILVRLTSGEIGRVKRILQVSGKDVGGTKESMKLNASNSDKHSLLEIINSGESHQSEFKTSILWSVRSAKNSVEDSPSVEVKKYGKNASKIIIAKTLAAFLNADGGDLVVGIKENKDKKEDEIVGIDSEFSKLADPCIDGYRRMILDGIIKQYFPAFVFNHLNDYIQIEFEEIDNKIVCLMHVSMSDKKVFLRIKNEDMFFIRVDASTRQIHGEEIVDYCVKRFS